MNSSILSTIIDSIDATYNSNDYNLEIRHAHRIRLEEPIFDYLRSTYGSVLKDAFRMMTIPTTSINTVLLVERREHPNIEFVLHNFMYFCKGFSLTIVCSDTNEGYIRRILGKHEDSTTILPLFKGFGTREEGIDDYNRLFTTKSFWESINAEYILSIQTDCYLRKPLPPILWTVDYVASPWKWKPTMVGGSGLTFRKKDCVIDICKLSYKTAGGEDVYFSRGCIILQKKVLSFEEQVDIFSESCMSDDPVGVHQWWTYATPYYLTQNYQKFSEICKIYTTLHITNQADAM
jgi:hypothetical protein